MGGGAGIGCSLTFDPFSAGAQFKAQMQVPRGRAPPLYLQCGICFRVFLGFAAPPNLHASVNKVPPPLFDKSIYTPRGGGGRLRLPGPTDGAMKPRLGGVARPCAVTRGGRASTCLVHENTFGYHSQRGKRSDGSGRPLFLFLLWGMAGLVSDMGGGTLALNADRIVSCPFRSFANKSMDSPERWKVTPLLRGNSGLPN